MHPDLFLVHQGNRYLNWSKLLFSEVCSKTCQISKLERFTKIVNKNMATQIFLVILNNETRSFNIGPFSVATDSHEILLIMRDTKKYVPPEIYLFKVNNGNTRKMFKRCRNLAITTPERRQEFEQNSRPEYEFFKLGQIDQ